MLQYILVSMIITFYIIPHYIIINSVLNKTVSSAYCVIYLFLKSIQIYQISGKLRQRNGHNDVLLQPQYPSVSFSISTFTEEICCLSQFTKACVCVQEPFLKINCQMETSTHVTWKPRALANSRPNMNKLTILVERATCKT